MFGGFLCYKVALVLKIYDDLKPRAMTEEEMLQAARPQLVEVEDVELDLRKLGGGAMAAAAAGGEGGQGGPQGAAPARVD